MFARSNRLMDKFVGFLRYDLKKALNVYTIILAVVPILFFAYIAFALNLAGMSLQGYFYKSPITAVMFIVCLVDIVVAYVLFFQRDVLLTSNKSTVYVFTALTIAQLAVGNLVSFVLGVIVLYLSRDIKSSNNKLNRNFMYLLIGCIPLYMICAGFLIKMGIH